MVMNGGVGFIIDKL